MNIFEYMLTQNQYIQLGFSIVLIVVLATVIIGAIPLAKKVLSKRIKINKSGVSIEDVQRKRREDDK